MDSSQSPDSLSPEGRQTADSEEEGEDPGYIQVLQQGAGNLNIKRLLLIKGKLNLSREEIELYSMYGKMQVSGLAKIIYLICI